MPSIRRHHHMTSDLIKNMGGKLGRETSTLFSIQTRDHTWNTSKKSSCNLLFRGYWPFSVPLMHHFYNSNLFQWNIFHHQKRKVIKMKQFFYYWGTLGCKKNFANICILLCYESVNCRCDDMTIADTNVGLIKIWGILQWSSFRITG